MATGKAKQWFPMEPEQVSQSARQTTVTWTGSLAYKVVKATENSERSPNTEEVPVEKSHELPALMVGSREIKAQSVGKTDRRKV